MMIKIITVLTILVIAVWGWSFIKQNSTTKTIVTASPETALKALPTQKTLANNYHIFQTFNNCGPAALSMALSYYGVNVTQAQLGEALRPYQIPGGDNDDKSVTLSELAEKSKEYNLIPYHRPNGNTDLIKQFINNDIPVIARTWLKENDDIGHYRVVKGFDDSTGELIQDDSLQGKNLRYTYDNFNKLWQKFNFEYLVLVPKERVEIAEAILGDEVDPKVSWTKATQNAQGFNLAVALYHIGEYQKSVDEFEKVENSLPFRTLWYQLEPVKSYFELGNYSRVLSITDKILNNQNRAYSEAYLLRGNVYLKQGKTTEANAEFDKARFYNKNLKIN